MKGRLAVLVGVKEVVIKELELPSVERGAVLLEILRANVCGSDLHIWKGFHPVFKRGVLGHEFIGRILELGAGVVTDFADIPVTVGDRIVAPYYITCLKCHSCVRGDFALCQNAYKFFVIPPETPPHFHGAFATHYYVHPNQYFYKVPDSIPDRVAAGANCCLSQVIYGLCKAGLSAGETIVIQGAGGLGLNAIAVAKEIGAYVIVIENVAERLKLAETFGADHIINIGQLTKVEERVEQVKEITGGDGADVVLEVAGVPAAFVEAIQLVRPNGRVIEMGNVLTTHNFEIPFIPGIITRKGLTIKGAVRYEPWYLFRALKFLERNHAKYPYEKLFDQEYILEDVNEALEQSDGRTVARAIVVPTN